MNQLDYNQEVIDLIYLYQDEENIEFDAKSLLKWIYNNGYKFVPR